MEDQIMNIRLTAIETRLAAIEGRLVEPSRRRKELTPDQRVAIRQRLVAGQERKRKEREVSVAAEVKKATKNEKKGAKNGTSEAAN